MKHLIIICTAILFSVNCNVLAQLSSVHDYYRSNDISLLNEINDTLHFPFAGGMNNCQFSNIDIDLDGTEDILIFDRHGNRILPFLVSGNNPVKYSLMPEIAKLFPPLEQWMQCIDYNSDGKRDIFTYTTGGIKVYRNDSDTELKFTQVTFPFLLSQQGTTLTNILVTGVDYPAIADVDGDGDFDVLSFWGLGSFVEWHRNTSRELYGTADSLTFVKSSSCWGHFAEGNEDNTIILDTCPGSVNIFKCNFNTVGDPKHTGSTLLLHDLNADGLPDLTLGDVDFPTLIHLTNGGTLQDARMASQTTDFPDADHAVRINTFPASMQADVNNDGLKDLLVSPFDPSLIKSANVKSVSLFMNQGTFAKPKYTFVSDQFIQSEMLDLGSGAYPVFFDYNQDGLTDILVGNYGYNDTCIYTPANGLQCTYTAMVALLLNTGTAEKPAFRLTDRNIAQLGALQMQSLIPALGDMDGDGDMDLVCGNSKGKLVYCENTAAPGQPAQFLLVDPAWKQIDAGDFSAPQLVDIDKDGLNDLICGKRNGTLTYYRNIGSANEPDFLLVNENFGGVDVTNTQLSNYGYSVPCFYKDKNGKAFLFAGSEFGEIFVYDQIDNNLDGNFRLLGVLPGIQEGWRSGIGVGNLNNDTLTDIMIGNYSGGIGVFYGRPEDIFGVETHEKLKFSKLNIIPNPTPNKVLIELGSQQPVKAENLLIRGLEGKIIRNYVQLDLPAAFDFSDLSNGVYIVTLQTANDFASGKLVISR